MQPLSPSSVSFQFYQMSPNRSLSPSLSIASIMICIICITNLPFAKPHSQIQEACEKYNTNFRNGTQSCVSILSTIMGHEASNLSRMALSGMVFAEQKVSETGKIIKNKLKDKSLKPKFYGALRTCMRLYNEASYSFGFGLLAFKEQNYDTVNYRWLNGAFYDVFQCERELNKVGIKGEDLGIKTEYILEVSKSAQAALNYFANN